VPKPIRGRLEGNQRAIRGQLEVPRPIRGRLEAFQGKLEVIRGHQRSSDVKINQGRSHLGRPEAEFAGRCYGRKRRRRRERVEEVRVPDEDGH